MKVSDPPGEAKRVDRVEAASPERVWKVGTLTYSFGGLSALFGWLLCGDFALAVRDRAMQGMIQLLFKKFGASDMFSGILFASLPSALGLVLGPTVGYKSDRLRTRWGRRIPYLLITTPFMVLALAALGVCPQLGALAQSLLGPRAPGATSYVLIFLGIFWFVFEVAAVVAGSVFGALINDVVPQEVVGRFFSLFRMLTLVIGIVFFFNLMGQVETHPSRIFLGVAAIYAICFSLMCLKVREGSYPPSSDSSGMPESPVTAIKKYFKDGFGHSFYLWYFASGILGNMATAPFGLYAVIYARSLSMDMTAFGKCLALTYCFSLVLSYPLGFLADRFHPVRVSYAIVICYTAVMFAGYWFVHDVWTFTIALVAHGVVTGSFFTASASLGQRLLPRAKFAEIGSAGGVLNSIVGIFVAPTVGLMLDRAHSDYRSTFLDGATLGVFALLCFTVLNVKFNALGGSRDYRAPGSDAEDDQLTQLSSAR